MKLFRNCEEAEMFFTSQERIHAIVRTVSMSVTGPKWF